MSPPAPNAGKPAPSETPAGGGAAAAGQKATAAPGKGDKAAPARPPRQSRPGRAALMLSLLALLLGAAALAGGGWLYLQDRAQRARLADLRASAEMRWDGLADHAALKALDERTRTLAERAAQRFAGLDKNIATLEQTVRAGAEDQIRNQRDWRLAEIEYVLRIASHRLALLRDVDGAIAALQTADRMLQELGSPVFLRLREQLDQDTRELRKVVQPDLPGLAIRLAGLVDQVGELAPAGAAHPVAARAQDAPADGFWNALQRLVVVKRNEQPVTVPPVRYAPRNHALALAVSLRSAQNAALAADTDAYQSALAAAIATLEEHFDLQAQTGTRFAEELRRLAAAPLRATLPDISASFALLEQMRSVAPSPPLETAQ